MIAVPTKSVTIINSPWRRTDSQYSLDMFTAIICVLPGVFLVCGSGESAKELQG